ncbi:UNVERIFIED_CONTAM: hypothetical protein Sradi_1537700 [Sesamum radiatum]|uniref:Zinc knuckle CX2CX4HX4C domain-containing protein n=1 Tax=Sesamum radiatum TaxID=300843 RepID=A0AAW2U8W7_SESRA
MNIKSGTGDSITVFFTYERLQNFRYVCGTLGHLAKFYEKTYDPDYVDHGEDTPYGSWLRASSITRTPTRNRDQ